MAKQLGRPLFVIGAPRSGTTYIGQVLNQHPEIFITSETRIMTYLNRCLNVLGGDLFLLKTERGRWLDHFRKELSGVVERFYEDLGAPAGAHWGDKNPHYADPLTDAALLPLIDELFPTSQFVHIVRDGRHVAASLLKLGWGDVNGVIDVWPRHVLHARAFGNTLPPGRYIEVHHEKLVADGPGEVARILLFLGLDPHGDVTKFLEEQRVRPKPFSQPTSSPNRFGEAFSGDGMDPALERFINHSYRELLMDLGYDVPASEGPIPAMPISQPAPDHLSARLGALAAEAPPGIEKELAELSAEALELEQSIAAEQSRVAQLGAALWRARARYHQLLGRPSVRALRAVGRGTKRLISRKK